MRASRIRSIPAEQSLLFSELAPHLAEMASFAVNTGVRDQDLCRLQWAWERRVSAAIRRPDAERVCAAIRSRQCGESRVVVLNDEAQAILERARGRHRRSAFVSERRHAPLVHLGGSAWQTATGNASALTHRRASETFACMTCGTPSDGDCVPWG